MYNISTIQLVLKDNIPDVNATCLRTDIFRRLAIETGEIKSSKIYSVTYNLDSATLNNFANLCLKDEILNDIYINSFWPNRIFNSTILISKLPGVTDDEAKSTEKTLQDFCDITSEKFSQKIFSHELYYFKNKLSQTELEQIAHTFLGNSLINHFDYNFFQNSISYIPSVNLKIDLTTETILLEKTDAALSKLSKDRLLSLNLEEMKAIKNHYNTEKTKAFRLSNNLPENPTDIELEIIAQTWSEHCKHKEFNAVINYKDKESLKEEIIHSLFKTYIKASTDIVQKNLSEAHNNWLIKVFSDNAGIARIDNEKSFVWKVETHNSPSALDPYGGAITGILGVNRDSFGTGIGGGNLVFNTNVLCFGPSDYNKPLLKGQLHPKQIYLGVRKGIEDGGNKSGIPTVNGSIIFEERFSGKPLVFCGTGCILPTKYGNNPADLKNISTGDLIIMAGGRVGKDGIHGATFSSIEINEHSPKSAVQIGSPITQKMLFDFEKKALELGLIKCSTDNGAGGLSSSIGELATITNGAYIDLSLVPLKYSGLKPWEIFVSESQERMTLVVKPSNFKKLETLATEYEVEIANIGYFSNSKNLSLVYKDQLLGLIDLDFLHDGVPQKVMQAEWLKPSLTEPNINVKDYNEVLLKLLGSPNICSREDTIRRYDHEVKGRSVIKPLMGKTQAAPQDAAVIRVDFDSYRGIAVSNGICPKYGDIDPYQMSLGAFDEAIRQIVSVGGILPDFDLKNSGFWSVNDNFCVPDSDYNEKSNPDGKQKLGKLVKMCQGLYDTVTHYNIPMTSGKDSMKNDFVLEGHKISVPPTVLYSVAAYIEDIRQTVTSHFKNENDLIYILGETYDELGASEFYKLYNELGANVPKVNMNGAKDLYLRFNQACSKSLLKSSHDLSDGGLAVTLCECLFGRTFGASITLPKQELSLNAQLFSESHSRFVVSIDPKNKLEFESIFNNRFTFLGAVTNNSKLEINNYSNETIISVETELLLNTWRNSLNGL